MKKVIFITLIGIFTGYNAMASAFKCDVNNHEDYSVEINDKKAAFFDNDSWIFLTLSKKETNHSHKVFKNKKEKILVDLDLTELGEQSFVTFFSENNELKENIHCVYINADKLKSGI